MRHCIFIQIYAKFVSCTTIWSTGAKGYDFSDEAIWMQDGRDEKTHDFSAYTHSALKSKKSEILEVALKKIIFLGILFLTELSWSGLRGTMS